MSLPERLGRKPILLAPGVCDALTAAIAADAGFEALYVSGANIAYTRLGRGDIGLTTMSEMADTIALIADRVDLPLIVDADTGFGNALNAKRTMRFYERAGAAALQVEDQMFPKRCGHLRDKTLIPTAEMVGKLKAMADARTGDTQIIARTDAIAVDGFDAALERGQAYREAGADVLFIEAPRNRAQLASIPECFEGIPVLANMVEGGDTPIHGAEDLERLGFAIAIFPGGIARALAHTAGAYYASLKKHGSNEPFRERMDDFAGLNQRIGTPELLAEGAKYEPTTDG